MVYRVGGKASALSRAELHEPRDGLEAELVALAHAHAIRRRNGIAPARELEVGRGTRSRASTLRRALVLADISGLTWAFVFALLVVAAFKPADLRLAAMLPLGICGWLVLANTYGLYDHHASRVSRTTTDDFPVVVVLASLTSWLGLLFMAGLGLAHPRLGVSATFWLATIAFVTAGRVIARTVVQGTAGARERTAIVGTGRVARRVAKKLASRPEYGLEVAGFLDNEPLDLPDDSPPYLGRLEDLDRVVHAYDVDRIIVAFSKMTADEQVRLLQRAAELGLQVDIVPRLYEVIGSRSVVQDLDGMPLVSLRTPQLSRVARHLKRALDFVVALVALTVLAPFFVYASWRIKRESPGPVFFRQVRMGAGGRTFRIHKFRSMYVDADVRKDDIAHLNMHGEDGPRMFKVEDDPRITPFGRILRKWSLDELPQLWDVLRGEMSLVGPRPLILEEDENILSHHRRRLHITPGITGSWQVLGRSQIPFSEMLVLDYLYVTNWSLWGDIKLMFQTVPAVLRRRGAF